MNRRNLMAMMVATPLAGLSTIAEAGRAPVYVEQGVAILGADTVAYHLGQGAVAGSEAERVRWRGAIWLFSNRRNRELFESAPRKFAPRFGGYCAYRLTRGILAPTDPRAFSVTDGRLYLMHSLEDLNAWSENIMQNIKLAENYWPRVLD